ncbi:MAG: ABC transporter permease [Clostridia bacterium]|nr:ABC transporter permease [Clostridia bacterium]
MVKYIVKRILSGLVTIVVLITCCFFLMHAIPGSPFSKGEQGVPEAVMQRLNEKYGLDQPIYKQYFRYMENIARGDFGFSYKNTTVHVNDLIARGFPISARIGILAILVSVVVGIALGIVSAVKRGSLFDGISMVVATIGVCVPLFVISVLLLYLFAGVLKWLPTYGLSTWKHYILPVACLSFSPIAYIARMTRSSMLEVMQQDYIRTARAKGVSEIMVICKHGLRNAILPVVTYLGTLIANLLTGSFIVERLFAIPGLGKYFVDSITARDYNIIMGVTIFLGIFVVICNLIVDVAYGIIDPRVKLDD